MSENVNIDVVQGGGDVASRLMAANFNINALYENQFVLCLRAVGL